MKRSTRIIAVILSAGLVLSAAGCQTYGEAAGLGAGVGAVTGAIIGNQSGNALAGAAIGAVAGGVVGLIAHDIKARKDKSQQETAQAHNYQPQQGEMLSLDRTEVMPNPVRPGEMFTGSVTYALLGVGGGVQVTESRQLLRGDQVIADVSSQSFTRADGTWVSTQEIRMPSDSRPGQYTLVTSVRTAKSAISGRAQFAVANL